MNAALRANEGEQQIQNDRQQWDTLLTHAYALLDSGNATEAYPLFQKARLKQDAYYAALESRLPQTPIKTRRQIAEDRVILLAGLGKTASLLGKLAEARDVFEHGLSLLETIPGNLRTALLTDVADVSRQQGELSDAERYYQQAVRDYSTLGLWDNCARALTSQADCAFSRGDPVAFLHRLNEAIRIANTHQLSALEHRLILKGYRFRLDSDPTGDTLNKLGQERTGFKSLPKDPEFQAEVSMLFAEYEQARGELQSAAEYLEEALECIQANPQKRWSVLQAMTRLRIEQKRAGDAVNCAEEALQISRGLGIHQMILQDLQALIPLRLKSNDTVQHEKALREMNEIRMTGNKEVVTDALIMRAQVFFEAQEYESALSDIEEAEESAPTLELQDRVQGAKKCILTGLNRREEALAANLKAIELTKQMLASMDAAALTQWKGLLRHYAALHDGAAKLAAELAHAREAFRLTERSRAQIVRQQLLEAGVEEGTAKEFLSEPTLDEIRAWLAEDSAAIAMFCVYKSNTLILILDPSQPEPQVSFVPLAEDELKHLLNEDSVSAEQWNETVLRALPALSSKLLPPLYDAAKRCRVLYIAPEASLYLVPFAALTFDDGSPLIQHCALSYIPSATVLKWCRSRLKAGAERTCLAVGVGSAQSGGGQTYSFAEQARAIAHEPPWPIKPKWLPEATAEQFLAEASSFTVLHLSCHGSVEPKSLVPASLSSSLLKFADRDITAKEVFDIGGQWKAQLVFLNACASGKFNSALGTEVGGFWQSFLHAGASSLIATLSYVHPASAGQLALEFYREWLTAGVTKAEALRHAQLKMHKWNPDPRHWAFHILIGDHR